MLRRVVFSILKAKEGLGGELTNILLQASKFVSNAEI
jgi:hypothetical protein